MLGRVHAASWCLLALLEGCGQGPAPAGEFPGDRCIGDNGTFFAGIEDFPFVVESVVAFQCTDPGGWVREDVPFLHPVFDQRVELQLRILA